MPGEPRCLSRLPPRLSLTGHPSPHLTPLLIQKRHTCTDLGELTSYLGLRITRDRAQRTITLTQSHMVQQVLQHFGFTYSSPQSTPLPTGHSLSAPPSDEFVEPSGPYPELVGCLISSASRRAISSSSAAVQPEPSAKLETDNADPADQDTADIRLALQGEDHGVAGVVVNNHQNVVFAALSSDAGGVPHVHVEGLQRLKETRRSEERRAAAPRRREGTAVQATSGEGAGTCGGQRQGDGTACCADAARTGDQDDGARVEPVRTDRHELSLRCGGSDQLVLEDSGSHQVLSEREEVETYEGARGGCRAQENIGATCNYWATGGVGQSDRDRGSQPPPAPPREPPTTPSASTAAATSSSPTTTTPATTTTTPATPTLATIALAAAAPPTRSRRSTSLLSTKDVHSSSRGNRRREQGGGAPLKD
ncbi:unnamed protein product [Closterium sp. NIES-53]